MIIKILFKYILGYVKITVEGYYIERFINICTTNKILIWNLKRETGVKLHLNIGIKDFYRAVKVAKKLKCKIKIEKKRGVPFLLNKYRKRKVFLIALIMIIALLYISSNYIWNIEIQIEENAKLENIEQDLQEAGLKTGKSKNKIDTQEIVNKIRLKRDDISWMSLDMKGTNIIVTLVEAEQKPDIIDKNEYCNIVADQRGIITKITADTGTALVKVGNIVEEGDILIGGYMEGKYTDTRYVHAKGEVKARVWYTKKVSSELTREISEETGKRENKYAININNFKINLYKTIPKFENYDTIIETNRIKLFMNFYLPIEIEKTTYIENRKNEITYGTEELKQLLIQELESKFEEEGINKLNVINKVVNVSYKENNELELEMIYEVETNIGTEKNLEI